MLLGRKGTIAWNLVATPWLCKAAVVAISMAMTQAVRAQSSDSITGQTLISGTATWEDLGGGNWLFTVGSQSAIINFTSFGIPEGAEVEFLMDSTARVLNRVLGDFPTQINGRLLASGQVFIVNPAGVFIGANGVVNVGALYAAAGDITDADFTAGIDRFTNIRGEIQNQGLIEAVQRVALIGNRVINSGVGPDRGIVVGDNGVALMIAHNGDVTMFEPGLNPQLFAVANGGPNIGGDGVVNTGRVQVGANGRIQLGAGDVYSVAIRNSGELRAQDGEIRMVGNSIVQSGGQLSASSFVANNGESGGAVTAADEVSLSGDINADTSTINATTVTLTGTTSFQGQGGAGNQANTVAITGDVVSGGGAPQSLVLDAANTTVVGDLGGADNARLANLTSTGNLTVSGDVRSTGDVFVQNALALNGAAAQTVAAEGDLDVGSLAKTNGGDATVEGKSVFVRGDATSSNGLSITATAGNAQIDGNTQAGGNLTVKSDLGDAVLGGDVSSANGDVLLSGTSVTFSGAAAQTVSAANGSVTVAGDAAKAAGDLTLTGESVSAGDVSATGGNLTVTATAGNATVGAASAGADASLTATGSVSAASVLAGNDATVSGASVNVAGNAAATAGALSVTATAGDATVGGNATAGGNVTVSATGGDAVLGGDVSSANGDVSLSGANVTFNGAAAQTVSAANGSVTVAGDAAKAAGDLTLTGESVSAGDVSATGGNLTVTATAGNATVGAASAGADASLTATGSVSAASVLAGNDATVSGASVNVAGNAAATAGALSVTATAGDATVGGNATAGGNVTVSGTGGDAVLGGNVTSANGDVLLSGTNVTFNGAAAQTVSATNGSVTVTGDAAKAAGDLTLTGESVSAGDVSATGGNLTVTATAGNATVGGNATAGGNVTVSATGGDAVLGGNVTSANGDVSLSGTNVTFGGAAAQTVSAANGSVTVTGDAAKAAGDLTLTGESVNAGDVSATAGSLTVTATAGDATVGAASAGGNASLTATGGVSAASVLAGNDATVSGASVNVAGNAAATAGALSVTSTAGDASVGGNATAGGNVTVSAAGGDAVLGGNVLAGDDVTLAGNAIRLGGNVTGGGDAGDEIRLTGPVTLLGNSTWSAFDITVDGTIDGVAAGAQSLTLAAANRSILSGNVGQANRLGAFTINDGFTQLGTAAGGSFLLNADIFTLAPASRPAGFGVDLGSPGALTINTGAFTMAQGTKATVLGDFTINNGTGVARLSDVNTVGIFEVNAGQIQIVPRDASGALTAAGIILDTGVDFVSIGGFRFSVVPILDGVGQVRFSTPGATGDLNGNLVGFPMLNLDDADFGLLGLSGGLGVTGADFSNGVEFFDLLADGTLNANTANAIAAAAPQETPDALESGGVSLSSSERRELESALNNIEIRLPSAEEALEIGVGSVAFRDSRRAEIERVVTGIDAEAIPARAAGESRALSAVVQRFSGARVRGFLESYRELNGLRSSSKELLGKAAARLADASAKGESLAKAVDAAREAGSADEVAAMGKIARFIQLGEELGLSNAERRLAARDVSDTGLWPQAVVADQASIPFEVPASAFDREFWMAVEQPIASK